MKLYSHITILFCIWAVSILTIFYLGFSLLPHSSLFPNDFLRNLANFDGGHYLAIAESGYKYQFQYAFFPLYPILINSLEKITGNYLLAGLLISFTSIFLGLHLFYQLLLLEFNKQFAQKALLLLLFFPMSFYFLTVYTEGLFFLLVVSTFLFAKKGNFYMATICAILASATRFIGLAAVLGFFTQIYLTGGINRKNWYVLFSPLGLVLYSFYLFKQTGDPFYFVTAQSDFWNSGLVIPGSAIFYTLKQLISKGFLVGNFRVLIDFIFAAAGIISILRIWRLLRIDYAIFGTIAFILPLFSPTIVALPRYLLTIFPIFIVLSFYKNQYFLLFYQFFSIMLLTLFATLFITGYWSS